MRHDSPMLHFLIIALGVVLSGYFIGSGFVKSRTTDRFVTVKGVSERDVKADIAIWPINFSSTSDVLENAQKEIEKNKNAILTFLEKNDIDETQIELQRFEVIDKMAQQFSRQQITSRYIISQTIMVRSEDAELIQEVNQKVGDLVEAGVVFASGERYRNTGPTYLFTQLNSLKPDMIAEATANARTAAEQFAKDSGSEIGGIRRANQGVFVILPRDRVRGILQENQIQKTVRVVSTVEYYLKD